MKQFTSPEQTAKLIELGFEKPKNTQYIQRAKARNLHSPFIEFGEPEFEGSYSIGELLEMLPPAIEHVIWWGDEIEEIGVWGLRIDSGCTEYGWDVSYERPNSAHAYRVGREEMIDALFDMIVELKEENYKLNNQNDKRLCSQKRK